MAQYSLPGAGSLKEHITVQTQVTVPDGAGGSSSAWTVKLAGVNARITPQMKGAEQVIVQGLQAVATYTIWVRSSSETRAITESDRILDERSGQLYNIRLIANPDEHDRFLLFFAERGVAQ